MKKNIKTILIAGISVIIGLVSCTAEVDFNDRLTNLEDRVSKLEKLCAEMNTNISSLQGIVSALQNQDYITAVNELTSDGQVIGYTINFAKGQPITIYHGKDGADGKDGSTPVIGVKQDTDGIWYWTLNGEWLLDDNGQKIKAVGTDGKDGQNGKDGLDGKDGKDGITPQLKIEDGYWYISYDNGTSWTKLDKAVGEVGKDGKDGVDGVDGDSMFQSVTVTETEVTFVTSDGQTFVVKRASALSIEFDTADLVVMGTNATRNIHYTITSGVDNITIEALSSADIKVKVVKTDAKTGTLQVKTGATIDEYSKVVVLVSNGSQAIMRTLNFEAEAIEVEENTTKEVSDEGGEVTLEFFSNTPCHAVIPEDAQSWISVAPETKALDRQTIGLIVQPNTGSARSANVIVQSTDGSIVLPFLIEQRQKPASKAILPYEYLPNEIDKTTITEAYFHVSDPTTTATVISAGDSDYEPIYFEKVGTAIHYYTVGEAYVLQPYSCSGFFNGWNSLETLDLSMWDISNERSMREMFRDCYALREVNLSGFDTRSVNDMSLMFHNCRSLERIDLSSFNTSNVQDMSNMFSCFSNGGGEIVSSALKQIDLSMFNTSNVTDVNQMFSGCLALESINLTGWNTENIENMSGMFQLCRSLKSLDLSSFDTGKVIAMSLMFSECSSLTVLDLSNFNTSNVIYFHNMFCDCISLRKLDISGFTLESMERVEEMLHNCVRMLQLDMSSFDVPASFVETDFCTSLAGKSKSCAVKCCDSAKQLIQGNYGYNSNYFIWVDINEDFPANTEVRDPNLYYSSDFSMHQTVEILQTASSGNGINIAIMGDQYSDRLIADGTYKKDMQTAIEGIFELEPYKTYRDYFNIKIVYLVSETEVCYSEGGSTALDVTNGLSNTIQANTYALSAFPGSDSQETAVIVICHDQHSFDGSGALGYTFTQYLPENNSYANDYGQAAQAVCWIPVYDEAEVFKSTVSHEFGHCFAKLFDEYEINTGIPEEVVINNQKEIMRLFGVGKNIDFTSDPSLIKWNRFLNDSRYLYSGTGIFEGGYIGSSGVWRPSDDSIMRSAAYGTVFNAPSREAIYYRIHKLAFGESWEYDYETFVQQDIKNIPQAAPAPAPKRVLSPTKANRKHIFKMEESISEDGKKMITIIQN